MKKILFLFIIIIFTAGCKPQTSNNYKSIIAIEFQTKLATQKNPQILDVRTAEEFATGHIANALNVNCNDINFDDKIKIFDKTKPVFVNCQGGGRSKKVADKLFLQGFKTIYELNGGINDWSANNFSLKK